MPRTDCTVRDKPTEEKTLWRHRLWHHASSHNAAHDLCAVSNKSISTKNKNWHSVSNCWEVPRLGRNKEIRKENRWGVEGIIWNCSGKAGKVVLGSPCSWQQRLGLYKGEVIEWLLLDQQNFSNFCKWYVLIILVSFCDFNLDCFSWYHWVKNIDLICSLRSWRRLALMAWNLGCWWELKMIQEKKSNMKYSASTISSSWSLLLESTSAPWARQV